MDFEKEIMKFMNPEKKPLAPSVGDTIEETIRKMEHNAKIIREKEKAN